jgi:hypothetical protein
MKHKKPENKSSTSENKQGETAEKREIVIDESGFVTNPDLWLDENRKEDNQRNRFEELILPKKKSSKPTNVFKGIANVREGPFDKRDPTKKRINPYYKIICPFCDTQCFYHFLYEHISTKHPEYNPKIVLAEINRKLRGET